MAWLERLKRWVAKDIIATLEGKVDYLGRQLDCERDELGQRLAKAKRDQKLLQQELARAKDIHAPWEPSHVHALRGRIKLLTRNLRIELANTFFLKDILGQDIPKLNDLSEDRRQKYFDMVDEQARSGEPNKFSQ